MAIKNRQGSYVKFAPDKLVPGEFAFVYEGDPNAKDGKSIYAAFDAGQTKRMATYEDMKFEMDAYAAEIEENLSQKIINVPDGAEPGQVIMIESIDNDGIAKWKAVEHYHMRKEAMVTWDGDETGLQYVTSVVEGVAYQYYKISDTPLAVEELIGCTLKFVKTSGEEVTQVVDESYITQVGDAIFYGDLLVSAIGITTIDDYGVTFYTGLWHMLPTTAGGYVAEIQGEVPVKIPEKFLPKMSSLPDVTAEDEGKHLEVKNGEWAAVSQRNVKTVMEEHTFDFVENESWNAYMATNLGTTLYFEITEGEMYTIVWDGTEYSCEAEVMSISGITGLGIGNKAIMGLGDDTGEPFIFAYLPEYGQNSFVSNDTAEATHKISIFQEDGLPTVTEADNGKFLQVKNGKWQAVAIIDGNEVAY